MGTTSFVNLLTGTISGATTFLDTVTMEPAADINVPAGETWVVQVDGTDELILSNTNLTPGANDGNGLGSATVSWADCFLASGGVINWNNGNVTLTHSAAALAMAGGSLSITNTVGTTGSAALTVTQGAHTAITANQPSISVPTVSLAIASGSTIAIGSLVHLAAHTYTGVAGGAAETISDAATLYISGSPIQGANAVLTRTHAIWVDDGIARFDGTLNATAGGALTGTWSDLGVVTTIDINGGTVDGTTIGVSSASTGKFTTLEATGILTLSTTSAITASTTQTQGQGAITTTVAEVSVCANTNDTVTLPTAAAGVIVHIFNNGAQTLQVFPASGDAIDGGAANASVTMTAGSNHTFIAHDATNWNRMTSTL